ncbi:MAG: tyrosine-type recombinase/integrase [Acidimicrobiales bacterium]
MVVVKNKGRRPSGDGSVYKAADGRWRGAVDLGWIDGKRRRKYVAGATQSEALEKLRQAQRAAKAGVVADDRITLGQFLERWLRVNVPGTVAPSTMDDYGHTVRLHLAPTLGRKRLSRLQVADVDQLWATKREAGYKPNSVRIMRAVLRRALAQAEREGLVVRNVASLSRPPRLSRPEGRALTVEQARLLLDTVAGNRLDAAYLILLSYGLRRGELLGLAWDDFDARSQTLGVRQSVHKRKVSTTELGSDRDGHGPRINLSELKTRRSRRVLCLTPGIVTALAAHAKRQQQERERAGAL